MTTLSLDTLAPSPKMPLLFVGHGSPMHAIEESGYTREWQAMGAALPHPQAILCVSAHWMTRGTTLVHVGRKPRTIHDFGGFPRELYEAQYPAPGAPEAAVATLELLRERHAEPDEQWGLDHGAWCVLLHMFPKADVPVYQLSLDLSLPLAEHMKIGAQLKKLREKGVLIVTSGNIVHNLPAMRWGAEAYDFTLQFDELVTKAIEARDFAKLAQINPRDPLVRMAHPTIDHFLPLLYTLGAAEETDTPRFFAEGFDLGSISMRSVVLG